MVKSFFMKVHASHNTLSATRKRFLVKLSANKTLLQLPFFWQAGINLNTNLIKTFQPNIQKPYLSNIQHNFDIQTNQNIERKIMRIPENFMQNGSAILLYAFSSKCSNMIQMFLTPNMQTQTPLILFLLSNIRSTIKLGDKTWWAAAERKTAERIQQLFSFLSSARNTCT